MKQTRKQSLNQAGDGAFNDFNRGVRDASVYIRNNQVDINRINLPKFYESFVKQYLATGMEDRYLWAKTRDDMREALKPRHDRSGRIILQPSKAPDIAEVLNMRDASDYQRGRFTTTAYTDNKFNYYVLIVQENLNKLGLTDKFGNPLKEDGILGPKTQWAIIPSSISKRLQDLRLSQAIT